MDSPLGTAGTGRRSVSLDASRLTSGGLLRMLSPLARTLDRRESPAAHKPKDLPTAWRTITTS